MEAQVTSEEGKKGWTTAHHILLGSERQSPPNKPKARVFAGFMRALLE